MSTYEKKHKEEVVRATQLWECGDITRENLEYIFPELAEPEDEKIRKELIDYINRLTVTPNNIDRYNSWIAWLEKQGEKQKKVSIWKHWKGGIAGNAEGEQIFLQKIGRNYCISSCLGCECDYIELSELDKLMREEKQEKSKWTEDDEKNLNDLDVILFEYKDIPKENYWHIINWLKLIKQRMEE